MIQVRWGNKRGHTELDWLNSYHSFSFGDYYDPQHMGFRHLRVINEDWVKPGGGFPTHSHRDMEILTYVLEGALEHKDSLGNGSAIRPGEVQRMSAGTGISHSEYNHSQAEPVHLLQIWILPDKRGLEPGYEQHAFIGEARSGTWQLIAAKGGRDGSVSVHQDVDVFVARLAPGGQVSHRLKPGRHAWVQVARGAVVLNGTPLRQGDGAAVSAEAILEFGANDMSEILLFDLA
jgi:redox-sensitive bicupin YhaK (pirin superfamily)